MNVESRRDLQLVETLDVPAADRVVEAIEHEATLAPGRPDPASPTGGTGKALRLLFVLGSPEYLRYFDSVMRVLADRGHSVLIGVNALRERKEARLELVNDARVEHVGVVPQRRGLWGMTARAVRGTMDFLRYLHPDFAHAGTLRARMSRKALPAELAALNRIEVLPPSTLARALRVFMVCERAIPVSSRVKAFITAQRPDAVIVSPLVDAASDQVDLVRASQAAGIPVVAAIASWDNLTNKGHMRVLPDLVTVWNEVQKREAMEYHGVPADRVVVTGAQLFDRWFDREPAQSRAAFCRMVDLPDERPFLLFTGSSVFIARSEVEVPFVRRWIGALRSSHDPLLRDIAVLVRPHPFNADAWTTADFSDLGAVSVWPRRRYTPADESARESFYDSLFHAAAVVGINTSAMIEAAILRKPVLSVLTPEFAGTQEGTIHFHYLLPEHGGFLRTASTLDAHVAQLGDVLRQLDVAALQAEAFVGRFLRPFGLESPGTPRLADALERAALAKPSASGAYGVALLPLGLVVASVVVLLEGVGYLRGHGGRKMRLLQKRLFVHPARVVLRAIHHRRRRVSALGRRAIAKTVAVFSARLWRSAGSRLLKRARQALRRATRASRLAARGVRWPAVRMLRLARLMRYHVAVRLRGGALTRSDSNDVQQ